MKAGVALIFISLLFLGNSQVMNVGVLHAQKVKRVLIKYNKGTYHIKGDGTQISSLTYGKKVEIAFLNNQLQVKVDNVVQGSYDEVAISGSGSVIMTSLSPSVRERKYEDGFVIKVINGRMTIVNRVSMENYLCGVLESEAGGGRHEEYYKVQSLLSRTYALRNIQRHKKDGFSVCDGVHCQAYHNMLRFTPEIRTAVRSTKGEVLVNGSNKLVTTYFSANCGGQVCDASHVWNNSVAHVETFKDTFCIHSKQSTWTKKVKQSSWRSFLVNEYGYPVQDTNMNRRIYDFVQFDRKAFYIHPSLGIPLRDLRSKFNLKSTFFSTHPEGDYVIINGHGFGHGVGLCQEGAMSMAKRGYVYRQIALYYFTGLTVRQYSKQ